MELKVGFWMKDSGCCLSHKAGLNIEQVEAIKNIKDGDRLILWKNDRKDEHTPYYTLKVFHPKEKTDEPKTTERIESETTSSTQS